MPYFINEQNGQYCVTQGTKESPGKVEKCHDDRKRALAHMGALYANVEDAMLKQVTIKRGGQIIPLVPGLYSFKADGKDRWIAIGTVDKKDKDGETFGYEAIDYAIDIIKQLDAYPELRVFHIKGLKAGVADNIFRVGPFMVVEGSYLTTALAKETQRVVGLGSMRVSLGFTVIKAAGSCPTCDSRLTVGPLALKYLFRCPECNAIHLGRQLKELRFLEAVPFDVTVTDRPSVPWTVITNKNIGGTTMLTKDQLKERLTKAGFDPKIVDPIVEAMTDEELARVKEEDAVDWFKELVETAEKPKEAGPHDVTPGDDGTFACFKCGSRMRVTMRKETPAAKEIEIGEEFAEILGKILKESMPTFPTELEFEIPGLEDRFKALDETNTKIVSLLEVLTTREEDRLKEVAENLSPASATRLTYRLNMKEREPEEPPDPTKLIITPDGKTYNGMSDFMGIAGGEA